MKEFCRWKDWNDLCVFDEENPPSPGFFLGKPFTLSQLQVRFASSSLTIRRPPPTVFFSETKTFHAARKIGFNA